MTKRKTKGVPDSVDVHVGQRLRVRRSLLGMSQEKLAEAIGLTFQQVQKYERGVNRISAGRLFHLSNILDVPISYFYDHLDRGQNMNQPAYGLSDNEQASFGPEEDFMTSKEALDLLRVYYSIKSPEARKDIIKFIKSMAERLS